MNRVFLGTGGEMSPAALKSALKAGRTFASNGPLLGLELDGRQLGDTVARTGPAKLRYRIALRSPVAVDHLELVQNGKVVKSFALQGDRRRFDADGELQVDAGGWLLLRAWNDVAHPQVLDLYPYATTSPVYLDLPGGPPPAPQDAAYFAGWLGRVIADAESRTDYRNAEEWQATIDYLRKARDRYLSMAGPK
jgi:TolB protein